MALVANDREQRISAAKTVSTAPSDQKELYELLTGETYGNAGVAVSERTVMMLSAVAACIGLLGGALASFPFHIYKRDTSGGGRDRHDSPLWYLFNESPWPNWTAASAWQWVMQCIGLRGDCFWRIHRGHGAYSSTIIGLQPLHPDGVSVDQWKTAAGLTRNAYVYVDEEGTVETVDQDDMLHFTGLGFNGKRSITPIKYALKGAGGLALDADRYAGAFFRNGARPDFALKTSNKLDKEQAHLLRTTWGQTHGGPNNAHLPAILTGGLEVQQLTMTSEDAQLLATRRFQIEEIARIFGVPPHMIGHTEKTTSTAPGVEQMSIAFIRYTMRRHMDMAQQEVNRKIWPSSRLIFGEFNADSLMDGDSAAQSTYLSKALGGPGSQGWMTVNEVRKLKNLKPIDGGNVLIFAGTQENSDASHA